MVMPLGPMALAPGDSVPNSVREKHSAFWWTLAGLFICIAAMEVVAHDIFAVLFYSMMAGIIVYMVKDSCKNMTMRGARGSPIAKPYCLLVTGMVCSLQAFFDLLALLGSVGGRRTAETLVKPGASSDVTTYTTKVTVHPFFDKEQGMQYNVQSALMVACPIVMVLAVVLTYFSYNEYTTPLFADDEAETGFSGYGYGGTTYGAQEAARPERPAVRAPLFTGTGQRLGN
ncbi:unnamed protein product [Effrenium voratum]|nr:unnamed protein product [Effrenium voratum]